MPFFQLTPTQLLDLNLNVLSALTFHLTAVRVGLPTIYFNISTLYFFITFTVH